MKHIRVLAGVLIFAAPAVASAGKLSAGAQIAVAPLGSVHVEIDNSDYEEDFDLSVAYGIAGQVDYWVTPKISVGLAPRVLLNLKLKDSTLDSDDAAKQIDIPVRVAYNHMINDKLTGFGYLALGYSMIMPPGDDAETNSGVGIGFGAGGRWALNEKMFTTAELGYDIGFQKEENGAFATKFLHIGLGVGSHF